MAFQAGGPHAQDRALEAVAVAYAEQDAGAGQRTMGEAAGKAAAAGHGEDVHRGAAGIGLVIGCSTFPTWNSYPGLFASLATGNAVVVVTPRRRYCRWRSPSRSAARCWRRPGFVAEPGHAGRREPGRNGRGRSWRCGQRCGSSTSPGRRAFGRWLEEHARQAVVYTEKAGVNMVAASTRPTTTPGCWRNLAFSLCLYSGQMCTTPQDLIVPADGVGTPQGRRSVDEFGADLAAAVEKLLGSVRSRRSSCSGRSSTTACCRPCGRCRVARLGGESRPGR